jgi:hypothetical protein
MVVPRVRIPESGQPPMPQWVVSTASPNGFELTLSAYSVEKLVAGMPPENSNAFGRSRMESAEETVTFDDVVS